MNQNRALAELCAVIQHGFPQVLAGWNLGLTSACPEDNPLLVDVFYVPPDQERALMRAVIGVVRRTERQIGHPVVVVLHDSENTDRLYAQAVARIRISRYKYLGTEIPVVCGYAPAA